MTKSNGQDERRFHDEVNARYDAKVSDLTNKTLNILVIGSVSSGKSSLINAFLRRGREDRLAEVGARSGVTTQVAVYRLDEHVCIVDSPGLDDIEQNNSDETKKIVSAVDVGILVISGSADATQKKHVDELRKACKRVFVVLNKIDEWDRLEPSELESVTEQWKQALRTDKIYRTCTNGFDPKTKAGIGLDVRGVDELRIDVENFVEAEGKALLLARQMGEKRAYAMKLIVGALVVVAGEAFIPGSAVYITVTQAGAISGLYYLYTGRVLSKSSVLALLPMFASQSVGSTLFLLAKSFLPPTGVVDAAAAVVAVGVTAAMLVTVNSLLASGAELQEEAKLRARYGAMRAQLKGTLSGASLGDLKSEAFWKKVIHDLMYA